jgi:predicted RNA-binding protein (virulence factor B family)
MLEVARSASLEVLRKTPTGVMLGWPGDEVFLPARNVRDGISPGDFVDVFLYLDSEDRLTATTDSPLAEADEFASLRVVAVSSTGAFLDWGLPKDLLLPFRMQLHPVLPEERIVVRVLVDSVSGRPIATTLVERFLEPTPDWLREGQAVELLAYEETELGTKAIIDGRFGGLLYHEPGRPGLEPGHSETGYIQRIRDDGKIDLSLEPSGKVAIENSREIILEALAKAGGRLDLGDRSEPEAIREKLGLSKKAFKRAIGALYRERRIKIAETSIELIDQSHVRSARERQ